VKFCELSEIYLTDPLSDFHKNRYVTRQSYRGNIRRLNADIGDRDLKTLTIRDIKAAHAIWAADGKLSMGHGLVTMLRVVIGFGAGILENKDCKRIRESLSAVKFQNAKPRENWMSAEQAKAIRDAAVNAGDYAIALAQALQFDCALRQKDVIGEWLPQGSDPRPSKIGTLWLKWVGGVTREEVDEDLILTHETSKRGKVLSFPLKSCPMVMEEWGFAPSSGPLVFDHDTGLPFRSWNYARRWRLYAEKAGVPKSVWNMDSRAGRITTVLAKGVPLEDARKLAGHSQSSTTSRYSRGTEQAIARALESVMVEAA